MTITVPKPAPQLTPENILLWSKEPLVDELQAHVSHTQIGTVLQHPLVYDIGVILPGLNNLRLEYKKRTLAEAIELRDWESVVFIHERPHRLNAFMRYVARVDKSGRMLPIWQHSKRLQELAIEVWIDSENIHQHQSDWLELFRDRPDGAVLGTKADLKAFAALPDRVHVYRGGGEDSFLSWTTQRHTAAFFAQRFKRQDAAGREVVNKIREQVLDKADIFAHFTGRGEAEVLSMKGIGI